MLAADSARFTPEHLQLMSTRTIERAADSSGDGAPPPEAYRRLVRSEIRHRRGEACPRAERPPAKPV